MKHIRIKTQRLIMWSIRQRNRNKRKFNGYFRQLVFWEKLLLRLIKAKGVQ